MQRFNDEGETSEAFIARYGGEEFSVIIPDARSDVHLDLARAIVPGIAKLEIPHVENSRWGIVTISAGGVRTQTASGSLDVLFREADARLYKAKDAGRNRAEVI